MSESSSGIRASLTGVAAQSAITGSEGDTASGAGVFARKRAGNCGCDWQVLNGGGLGESILGRPVTGSSVIGSSVTGNSVIGSPVTGNPATGSPFGRESIFDSALSREAASLSPKNLALQVQQLLRAVVELATMMVDILEKLRALSTPQTPTPSSTQPTTPPTPQGSSKPTNSKPASSTPKPATPKPAASGNGTSGTGASSGTTGSTNTAPKTPEEKCEVAAKPAPAPQQPKPVEDKSPLLEPPGSLPFKEKLREIFANDKTEMNEEKLRYGMVAYQLYQKSPTIERAFQEAYRESRANKDSVTDAVRKALIATRDKKLLENWEVNWVYSLTARAAQLDSQLSTLSRTSTKKSFEEVLQIAEVGLASIATGSTKIDVQKVV